MSSAPTHPGHACKHLKTIKRGTDLALVDLSLIVEERHDAARMHCIQDSAESTTSFLPSLAVSSMIAVIIPNASLQIYRGGRSCCALSPSRIPKQAVPCGAIPSLMFRSAEGATQEGSIHPKETIWDSACLCYTSRDRMDPWQGCCNVQRPCRGFLLRQQDKTPWQTLKYTHMQSQKKTSSRPEAALPCICLGVEPQQRVPPKAEHCKHAVAAGSVIQKLHTTAPQGFLRVAHPCSH